MSAPHGTADQYAADQAKEWTAYVAGVPIDYYGTRAYNTGDPVPRSAVEGDGAWIDKAWVKSTSGRGAAQPFDGSQTVVDPAGSVPATAPAAAPVGSTPTPPAS